MVDAKVVKRRLKELGVKESFWGKPELDELPKILIDDEIIEHIINGHYGGGFATLCATNQRLLLIDKKMFFLTVEDIRYDMIAEVDYGHQMIGATIHVRSFSKDLIFQTFKKPELRDFTHFIQQRVMELRGHQSNRSVTSKPEAMFHRQAIPMQVFETNGTELTDNQAESLVPLSKETWYKINPARKLVNPYRQTPLITRRRVGRFYYADK